MRATSSDSTSKPSLSLRHLSAALTLRRPQVASLDPSSDESLRLLSLLHSRLASSLHSLLPSFSLSLPSLLKLLSSLLASLSDLLPLLSLNPSPPRNPSPDFLDLLLKSLDLLNSLSLSLHSLRHWARFADIAADSLRRHQFNRARRALSKLLSLHASSSSSRRIRSAKKHSHLESGGGSALSIAVCTVSALLHFAMWALTASFGGIEIRSANLIPDGMRQMPWALALSLLYERVGENVRRGRKEGGLLEEVVEVERCARGVFERASDEEEVGGLGVELGVASERLEEGLGPFERKVREVFHRLVWCREEVVRCLGERSGGGSCVSSVDSV